MDYVTGYIIALIFEICAVGLSISTAYSTQMKNMAKVNMYYHIASGRLLDNQKPSKGLTTVGIIFRLIVTPLFSWLSVGYYIYLLVKDYMKKINTPEKLKEIQYKLKSVEYNQDEVIELLRESAKFQGTEKAFEAGLQYNLQSDDEDYDTLILEDDPDGMHAEINLWGENKYRFYFHSSDYWTCMKNINEYRINDDFSIDARCVESEDDSIGANYFEIKDGVVCKSDIKKREKEGKGFKSAQVHIKELEESIKWSPIKSDKIVHFLLDRSGKFARSDLNTFFRKKIEDIKELIVDIESYCEKNKVEFKYDEDIAEYVIEGFTEKNEVKIRKGIDKITQKLGIDGNEYPYLQDYIDEIEQYIK